MVTKKIVVAPFVRKSIIPGGVASVVNGLVPPNDMNGTTKDAVGRSIKSNNIELGDIMVFNYIGRDIPDMSEGNIIPNDEKMVLNPMIVFAGFDLATGNIVGVDFRRFRLAKQTIITTKLVYALKKYYYNSEFDSRGNEILRKKGNGEIPYKSQFAFRYENFGNGLYSPIAPALKKYYRSYSPKRMRNALLINIEQAETVANQLVKALPGILPE
jgi:hypothetical protein